MGLKQLAKETGIYTFSSGIASLISFLLVPVFTRLLSASEYGLVATAASIQGVLLVLILLGLHSAVGREYFSGDSPSQFSRYLATTMNIVLLWGGLLFGMLLLVPQDIIYAVLMVDRWVVIAACIMAFAGAINLFRMTLWQMAQKPFPYGLVTVLNVLVAGILGIVAVLALHMGAAGRIWGMAIASAGIALVILPGMWNRFRLSFVIDKTCARKAFSFGLPLVPHDLSNWVMSLADRILLGRLANLAVTGIYSVGVAFCQILSLVVDGFGRSWVPFVYAKLAENAPEAKREVVQIGKFFVLFVSLIALGISVFSYEIVRLLLRKDFYESAGIIPLVNLGFVANSIYRVFVIPLFYSKNTAYLLLMSVTGAVLNVTLNFLFIPRFLAIGAAWAALGATIVRMVLTYFYSQKKIYLPWGVRFFSPLFFSAIATLYIYLTPEIAFGIRLLVFLLFLGSMLSPVCLSNEERRLLCKFIALGYRKSSRRIGTAFKR